MEGEYDLFGEKIEKNALLRDKFIEPPFSVLDTKTSQWQNRKRAWKQLGIQSEMGRDVKVIDNSFAEKYGRKDMPEASIFDPALCELMYHWFCVDGGNILDPFAGGSVRGIVANYLGYNYTGIELRQEQVDSNRVQAADIVDIERQPQWYFGDSDSVLDSEWNIRFDFIFSCPPYFDLEKYSDDENDLSTMDPLAFETKYQSIITKSVALLKPGCLACFVVGDVRDKKGYYRGLPDMTRRCFENAGAMFYNDCVLLQPLGTAMLRANRQFTAGLKVVKVHENVLVFKKPQAS